MELINVRQLSQNNQQEVYGDNFIEANTELASLDEIRENHIIPVFAKDNTPTISQADFIETSREITESVFGKPVGKLSVRVSHPIKGRIFEARHKKASELLEHEKTIYYERMAFSLDIPSIRQSVAGREMCLSVVGVKAYNQDNLNRTGGSLQRFKLGIGFKVKVCTNLCIFTDGASLEVKASSLDHLGRQITELLKAYDGERHLQSLQSLQNYNLSEQQFATILGRTRLYNHLPPKRKEGLPGFVISDSQVSTVARMYYQDEEFGGHPSEGIHLWNLYNLFTGAVKASYIDTFLDRNQNAFQFVNGLAKALDGEEGYGWFLN
jgi:hypothetical protein